MSKFTLVKLAVKVYFVTALGFSFAHIVTACGMLGATRIEAVAATLMIDGFFVLGAIMRTDLFSGRFREIGLWVQVGAGLLSLTGNVYAATSTFGVLFGIALPLFVVFTEWLADPKQMQTAAAEQAAQAAAAEQRAAERAKAEAAARKAAGIEKMKATRAQRAENRRAEVRALERLVSA
jgi:hypothetical protein